MATTLTTTCDVCGKSDKDSLPVCLSLLYGSRLDFCGLNCVEAWLGSRVRQVQNGVTVITAIPL